MEAMEFDSLDVKDDHNHNYCGSGAKVRRFLSGTGPGLLVGPDLVCDSAAQTQIPLSSVLNAMAVEDYRKNHWPNLEKAIDRLLIQNPADHVSVSYAQIYGYIYKCVCQQHSELLYRDLTSKITAHLQQVSTQLQASPAENLIENFNAALTQFTASLQCIVPVFIYFNKFYIESKLNRDLKGDLMQLFAEHVAEKHLSALMHLLITAHSKPFQVQPSTMASVVKGLYSLQPGGSYAPQTPQRASRKPLHERGLTLALVLVLVLGGS
uniref:CDK2 associated cullin domain 1 n=1 Tax=Oryzias sinensis TaxID=183150 RepID=A0A8C7Y4L7_9TELE